MAADTTDDFSTDLAFLSVKGVKRPPNRSTDREVGPTEGMAYTAGGFPFGGMLGKVSETSSKGNPSVQSREAGSRHSERRSRPGPVPGRRFASARQQRRPDRRGEDRQALRRGRGQGAASVDTIGFVVPADNLRQALAGRVVRSMGTRLEGQNRNRRSQVKAQVVDPKGTVKSVVVHVAPASAGTIAPNSDGSWPPLPQYQADRAQEDTRRSSASGRVQVP